MSIEDFNGWRSKVVYFKDGGKIIAFFYKEKGCGNVSLYDINHNVYRLDQDNHILWQVQRDDSNMPDDWWETMHAIERKHGREGERAPFRYMLQRLADGDYVVDEHGGPPDYQDWQEGSSLLLRGSLGRQYLLDIETGIAKNITDGPVSVWNT